MRIIESEYISNEQKEMLRNKFNTLNPFELKTRIELKLKTIFKDISVTSIVEASYLISWLHFIMSQ